MPDLQSVPIVFVTDFGLLPGGPDAMDCSADQQEGQQTVLYGRHPHRAMDSYCCSLCDG